ncbi:unnamed protein product [Linum trigynum]|uniref:Uncharacterized protein n=1 Tax=Linum trigynum TaxID=586398 RepID=A0AAV2CF65_9ROSI
MRKKLVVDFRGTIERASRGNSSSAQERVLNSGRFHQSRHSASDSIQGHRLVARIQRCRGPDDDIIERRSSPTDIFPGAILPLHISYSKSSHNRRRPLPKPSESNEFVCAGKKNLGRCMFEFWVSGNKGEARAAALINTRPNFLNPVPHPHQRPFQLLLRPNNL